jgi:hypothetical protein
MNVRRVNGARLFASPPSSPFLACRVREIHRAKQGWSRPRVADSSLASARQAIHLAEQD